ncbi:MAG TPA: RimK/LysX family protein [Polyangiaceae bacterium]
MSTPLPRGRVLIGTTEAVSIPDWGVLRLPAKIDTGARTSALHVEDVEELSGGRVCFRVCSKQSDRARRVRVEASIVRRGRVRASNGRIETRLFVRARIELGDVARRVEIGLVDRRDMLYRMLLGRTALAGTFVIDPGKQYVLGR